MIQVIEGDLLDATEQYIAHQTNCSSKGAAGIAKAIFAKFSYADVYTARTKSDTPGTIKVMGNGKDQRFVINMFAQRYPGLPSYRYDSVEDREQWFKNCLFDIAKLPELNSIAFPYGIGCGLAGGDWDRYLEILTKFSERVLEQRGTKVALYRLSTKE